MRKDRVSVRLFLLSNTILAPNLLPLSAHSQQDEVSLRAATDGEMDGGGLCWRRSKYVNHLKALRGFLEEEERTVNKPMLLLHCLYIQSIQTYYYIRKHVIWIVIKQNEFFLINTQTHSQAQPAFQKHFSSG